MRAVHQLPQHLPSQPANSIAAPRSSVPGIRNSRVTQSVQARQHVGAQASFVQGETWKARVVDAVELLPVHSGEPAVVLANPPPYYTTLNLMLHVPTALHAAGHRPGQQHPSGVFSFITPNVISDMHYGTIAPATAGWPEDLL